MAIDLGLNDYILKDYQNSVIPGANPNISNLITGGIGWSVAKAAQLSGYLPNTRDPLQGPVNDQQQALRNFLALYAVTRKDGTANIPNNGTWEDLTQYLVNAGAQTALFGDGSKEKGLISSVLIGDTSAHGVRSCTITSSSVAFR